MLAHCHKVFVRPPIGLAQSPKFGEHVSQRRRIGTSIPRLVVPHNEPIHEYAPNSPERVQILAAINKMKAETVDVPIIIGNREIRTNDTENIVIPHNHKHKLGKYHKATLKDVELAIQTALEAREKWAKLDFEHRASIFLKFAEKLSGPWRATINASTVLGQSKNFFQAEIDAACELIDFVRFNVYYAQSIYNYEQPISSKGVWNRVSYRPLEGFVYSATPFNFTAIGGNLTFAPALMGNVVIWKPSESAIFSNFYLMKLLQECGLPPGVINFVPGDPQMITDVLLSNPDFAGLHFTGSTSVFQSLWQQVGNKLPTYKSFPRLVGETGGKDFIFAHPSAEVEALVTAMVRGSFEFAGQKCSASSRAYIPSSLWLKVKQVLEQQLKSVKLGNPEHAETFVNAVINKRSFDKIVSYIEYVKNSKDGHILFGGKYDDSAGYFVEPTVVLTTNPNYKTMVEEIFGPVLTIYVYEDSQLDATLKLCDQVTKYALTGSIFARDRYAIQYTMDALENSAGNFYINDKPTGAVVGQQPFGGARMSGTNDKAGSYLNLLRWVSPRTIKETFVPPTHPLYSYMK